MPTIAFICTGNVCRSLFAKKTFERMIRENCLENIKILSGGTSSSVKKILVRGDLKEVFDEYGIDYADHVPRTADKKILKKSDAVLVMTEYQKAELEYRFPESCEKIFLLSYFASGVAEDIEDPIGLGKDAYIKAFEIINVHLKNLLRKISVKDEILT